MISTVCTEVSCCLYRKNEVLLEFILIWCNLCAYVNRHLFQRWFHVIPTYIICSISCHKYDGFTVAALEMSTSQYAYSIQWCPWPDPRCLSAVWVLIVLIGVSSKWLVGQGIQGQSCRKREGGHPFCVEWLKFFSCSWSIKKVFETFDTRYAPQANSSLYCAHFQEDLVLVGWNLEGTPVDSEDMMLGLWVSNGGWVFWRPSKQAFQEFDILLGHSLNILDIWIWLFCFVCFVAFCLTHSLLGFKFAGCIPSNPFQSVFCWCPTSCWLVKGWFPKQGWLRNNWDLVWSFWTFWVWSS